MKTVHLRLLHPFQQITGKDEVGEFLIGGSHDILALSLPFLFSLIDEDNVLTDTHH